jgi:hypothetical protein
MRIQDFAESAVQKERVVSTLEPGKSVYCPVSLFGVVEHKNLKPGTYTVRLRFSYGDLEATSDEIKVEITQAHIDDFPQPKFGVWKE